MKSKGTMAVTVLTISILSMALFAYSIDSQPAFAHHKDGHTKGPSGGEDPPTDPPSSDATIELIDCDVDGEADKWNSDIITYRVINRSGEKQSTIDNVIAGVEEWNTIKGKNDPDSPYTLNQVASNDNADITIEVFKKITPGYILGFASVCDTANDLYVGKKVDISLGNKGLSSDGIKNLAAHEVGHGLGLGHTIDNSDDLMAPSLDAKERKNLICPSNLNVGAFSETSLTYMVDVWEILIC